MYADALHKCAIIETSEMKAEFIRYVGFELIAFENTDAQLLNKINQELAENPYLKELVKVRGEQIDSKPYTVVQF